MSMSPQASTAGTVVGVANLRGSMEMPATESNRGQCLRCVLLCFVFVFVFCGVVKVVVLMIDG